jgi:type I restriction enzyme M protein
MSPEQKQAIIDYINQKDPNYEIVKIDEQNKKITYFAPIKWGQAPKFENEGYVRAYLVVKLIKELSYPADCIELETDLSVRVGRTKLHKGRDRGRSDILVFRRTKKGESLFLGIECKTPDDYEKGLKDLDGQLWGITKAEAIERRIGRNVRYLAFYTCELAGGELQDKAIVVDFEKFQTYRSWIESGSQATPIIPVQYNDAPQGSYANVTDVDSTKGFLPLNRKYTRTDFDKLRVKLHNQLWAGSSTDDNSIFYQLTKIFLVKVYDELITDINQEYNVQIRTSQSGEETPEELHSRLEKLYNLACHQLLNYDDEKLRRFPFLVEGFTTTKLFVAVKELQGISLTENENSDGYDVLGAFFEGILTNQEFVKQGKGSFFTHQKIVRFMIAMVGLDDIAISCLNEARPRLPFVIDPSSGSGTFLIEAMRFITTRVKERYSEIKINRFLRDFYNAAFNQLGRPNSWAADFIYGIEPNPQLGLAAKVNMILHGDGSMNIFIDDGLHPFHNGSQYTYERSYPDKDKGMLADSRPSEVYEGEFQVNERFDALLSNPPFSLTTDALESTRTHEDTFLYANTPNSENLFIERYYQLLREGGQLGVVLPESVFDTTDNKYIRLFLYRYFRINAVVSLPKETFQPFTSTKVSLLFATKKTAAEIKEYSRAWGQAAREYQKLRGAKIIQAIIQNDNYLYGNNGLRKLASDLDVELEIPQDILDQAILSPDLEDRLQSAINSLPDVTKKEQEKKTDATERLKAIHDFVSLGKFNNLPKTDLDILRKFLRHYFPERARDVREACEMAYDEIVSIARLDWPDYLFRDKYVNAWWCFAEISSRSEFSYPIFFASAKNIGYKRKKRGEVERPNDLYVEGQDGFPVVDMQTLRTILDQYKALKSTGTESVLNDTSVQTFVRTLEQVGRTRNAICSVRILKEEKEEGAFRFVRIGKILNLEYGSPLKEDNRKGGIYPVVGSSGIVGYHDSYLVEGPGIVVGRKGSAGKVTYIKEPFWPIDTTFYVKLKLGFKMDMKVLAFLLKNAKLDDINLEKAVPGLNRFDVYDRKIPILTEDAQQQVLDFLAKIEDDLRKIKEMEEEVTSTEKKLIVLVNGDEDLISEESELLAESS